MARKSAGALELRKKGFTRAEKKDRVVLFLERHGPQVFGALVDVFAWPAAHLALLLIELRTEDRVEEIVRSSTVRLWAAKQLLVDRLVPPFLAGIPGTPFAAFRRACCLYLHLSGWRARIPIGTWIHDIHAARSAVSLESALLIQIAIDDRARFPMLRRDTLINKPISNRRSARERRRAGQPIADEDTPPTPRNRPSKGPVTP